MLSRRDRDIIAMKGSPSDDGFVLNDLWLLVSGILVFLGLVTSQGLLLVVGSLVIIVWAATRFWNRFAFRGVSHQRTLSRKRAFVGDAIEYTISLTNDKFLPLIWLDIQDTFPVGLELPGAAIRGSGTELQRRHRITTSLLPYQRISWKYTMRCQARGYHRIGPVQLRSGDIFGFVAAEITIPQTVEVLVYPRVVELRQLILPSSHPLGEARGQRPLYQDPSRFRGLREYQPTDPMKHIDWKATARRGSLQTRVFEPVVSLNVLIALNAATSEHAWQGSNRRLFERSVTAAASVAKHAADRGFSFGLVSNAVAVYSGKWLSVPFGGSSAQLGMVLELLAMAAPYVVTTLADVLHAERDSLPPGATVALVTAVVLPALVLEVQDLRSRGYRVILLYAGDGVPELPLPGVPVYRLGRELDAVEEEAREPVLAH
ncbi:MAG: DUF58 domain-containing protein [Dehalococcoidia bacterium]|nr:DUF58 domain-containing protein [Dehalococcoidia bacterium]MSQ16359.1 DUF58 domain-containing protein [Dehalococcoidia bacterium]